MKNAKGTFIRVGSRIGWRLGVRWYSMTQRRTVTPDHPVQPAGSVEEILARLAYGQRYKADPRVDNMVHPTFVQKRIDLGESLGDCDDHFSYMAACLHKSRLASPIWLATVQFQNHATGEIEGHALTRYRVPGETLFYVVDYDTPYKSNDLWGFVTYVCDRYDAKPLFAATAHVRGLTDDDTLILVPDEGKGYK